MKNETIRRQLQKKVIDHEIKISICKKLYTSVHFALPSLHPLR